MSLITLAITSLLAGLAESGVLTIIAEVAASLVNGNSKAHFALGPLHTAMRIDALLVIALLLAGLRLALQVPIAYLPARVTADLRQSLRSNLFSAFSGASWSVQSRDREGYLQEIATNQMAEAVAGIQQSANLLTALLSFLVLVVSALVLNVVGAIVVVATAAGLFLLLRPLSTLGSKYMTALSHAYLDYANGISEATRLAEETKVFGVAAAEQERIERLNQDSRDLYLRGQIVARLVPGFYQSLIYLFVVIGLLALYGSGTGHAASLGAVVLLLVRAGSYGQQTQASYHYVRQSVPYLERVLTTERDYRDSAEPAGTLRLRTVDKLTFDRVSYAYTPDKPALASVSFDVHRGESIGIVGPTGAGKSTLIQILIGLRQPDCGHYLVNGIPADHVMRDQWREKVAYVPQEPRLLHASVADNIRYFRPLGDSAIERAAQLAGIHDEIMAWPRGYDTVVGPRADAVSGGQRQRICLARALARVPEILVLDEPTSALDPGSEMRIQESLAALTHELTLFIVAHRMSTLSICERVMVIVNGRLEAFDGVSQLLATSSYYRSAVAAATRLDVHGTPATLEPH